MRYTRNGGCAAKTVDLPMPDTCSTCGKPRRSALPTLLRRAAATSALVGTALVLINQGGTLLSAHPPTSLWWRVPLTYLVPFSVSLHAGWRASRG